MQFHGYFDFPSLSGGELMYAISECCCVCLVVPSHPYSLSHYDAKISQDLHMCPYGHMQFDDYFVCHYLSGRELMYAVGECCCVCLYLPGCSFPSFEL